MSLKEQITETYNKAKEAAKNARETAEKNRTEAIAELKAASKPWKKLGQKAIGGSIKLAQNQRNMLKEAYEEVKELVTENAKQAKAIIKAKG